MPVLVCDNFGLLDRGSLVGDDVGGIGAAGLGGGLVGDGLFPI